MKKTWENLFFSEHLRPDWENTARVAMVSLGSVSNFVTHLSINIIVFKMGKLRPV